MRLGVGLAATILGITAGVPAQAQLVRDEVRGDARVCTYFGSDLLPNGALGARTVTVGLGQSCPATAPNLGPNQRPPDNATLRSEATNATNRICTYEQGGIEYQLSVPITIRCGRTPALLEREGRP